MNYSAEEIQEKFDNLPSDVRAAMTSVDFANSLQEIGKQNNLLLDSLDKLFEIVGYVMLGLLKSSEFSPTIKRELDLDDIKSRAITEQVD